MKNSRLLIVATIAALFAAPAFAQGNENSTATLRVDIGSAMASTGGEFATVPSGTQLAAGNRVMLAEGNQATLVYDNGCTQSLKEAGVYTVSATCVAAAPAGATAAGVDVGGAAIVTGIAVGGAAILHGMDDKDYVPPPPVSR